MPKTPKKPRSDKGVKKSFLKFEDHGTTRGYGMFGCRCPDCRRAAAQYNRKYREGNRDKYNAAMRRSARSHPERQRRYSAERMAAPFDADALKYCDTLEQDPCSYHPGSGGTIDHIVAIKAGGDSAWDNLTAACQPCNASKGVKSLLIFMLHHLEMQSG